MKPFAAGFVAIVLLTVAQPAAATCDAEPGWATSRQDHAAGVVRLVNEHRSASGLPVLRPSLALTRSALWKSRHMAYRGYFHHDDPAPPVARSTDERMAACGAPSWSGENIAKGYSTAAAAVQGWLDSPGHRRNIESRDARFIGVGVAESSDGETYWTQAFGSDADDATGNPFPAAGPDVATTPEDTPVTVAVLTNDSDDDQAWLHVGKLDVGRATRTHAGHAVLYRPAHNFFGIARFRYSATDLLGQATEALVEVEVTAVNDDPRAVRDRVRVRRGRAKRLRPLANDYDVDGDSIRIAEIVAGPSRGSARIRGPHRLAYRPRHGFRGRDRLVYAVSDGHGGHAQAAISLYVR